MNSADRRVWELLQTIDLENLDIATFQGVAAPIFAQKENKEALEALALIAFARMARQGEFNGWLNAGGGSSGYATSFIERFTSSEGDCNVQMPSQAFGGLGTDAGLAYGMLCYPFVATNDGAIDAIQVYCSNAIGLTSKVGVYSTSDKGLPETLQVSCTFAHSVTGVLTQTSLTGSLTLEKGTNYWIAIIPGATSQQFGTVRNNDAALNTPIPQNSVYGGTFIDNQLFDSTLGGGSLPATIGTTELARMRGQNQNIVSVGLRQA